MTELFAFETLRETVEKTFKIDTTKIEGSFVPPPEIRLEIKANELHENIEIKSDGIYVLHNGKKEKGFLYIEKGYNKEDAIQRGWGTIVPKFHIAECSTIKNQKRRKNFDGHYIFSNQPVFMEDLDGKEKDLLLCGYCKNEQNEINTKVSSSEYVEVLMDEMKKAGNYLEVQKPRKIEITSTGYTKDWEVESKAYRLKQNYTCEDCGIELHSSSGYFLDTHHISGVKTDNSESNLKCLCKLCHANVNSHHQKNFFNSKRNLEQIKKFVSIYKSDLEEVNNKYLRLFVDEYLPELKSKIKSTEFEKPTIGHKNINENETGITYKKLLGPYLIDSSKIEIIDPYLRKGHQLKNLKELCLMISEINQDFIVVDVKTWISYEGNDNNSDDSISEAMEKAVQEFDKLKRTLKDFRILLSYEFDSGIHDRSITSDSGWKIVLGRGLDIWKRVSPLLVGASQSIRKTKAFGMTYIKQ